MGGKRNSARPIAVSEFAELGRKGLSSGSIRRRALWDRPARLVLVGG